MVKVGDVCPLFFSPIKNEFGLEMDYVQRFHTSDKIHIQVFASASEEVSVTLNNLVAETSTPLSLSTYNQNDNVLMYYVVLSGLDDARYTVTINGDTSEPFEVWSSDTILKETTLIRYSHKSNNSFDGIFWINDTQQVFEFRVEAGIKPEGYSSHVINEQYRNQKQEIEELYAVPYDVYTLTIGSSKGVPYWFSKLINRILCLSMVEIKGKMYVRSGSSTPEKIEPNVENSQLFVYNVSLELKYNDISSIGGTPEPASPPLYGAFVIDNATDGQLLQFKADKSAFTNVTTVEV